MSDPAPTLVTLFTDASYCHTTGLAAWAAWAKADGRSLERSGLLRGKVEGSDLAELAALVNGIVLVIAALELQPGARIIAQTDCTSAITAADGAGYRKRKAARRAAGVLAVLHGKLAASGVEVEYRHVRGHAGGGIARSWVNSWCDRECRRHLRAARKALVNPAAPEGADA